MKKTNSVRKNRKALDILSILLLSVLVLTGGYFIWQTDFVSIREWSLNARVEYVTGIICWLIISHMYTYDLSAYVDAACYQNHDKKWINLLLVYASGGVWCLGMGSIWVLPLIPAGMYGFLYRRHQNIWRALLYLVPFGYIAVIMWYLGFCWIVGCKP